MSTKSQSTLPKIDLSRTALVAQLLMPQMKHLSREHFIVLSLRFNMELISQETVYQGTASTIAVSMNEILRPVIIADAENFIIAHNHPGGNPHPSDADLKTTKRLRAAAEILNLNFCDHMIIGWSKWYSMQEHGVGGFK